MPDYSAILKPYNHWDEFIRLWKIGARLDAPHLPEPCWDWHPASREPLHSVVVNLSQGAGGKLQSQVCMAYALGCGMGAMSYSAAMLCGAVRMHLAETERWHYRRRYLPLIHALGFTDDNKLSPDTRHHLNIELAPYHSDSPLLNSEYLADNKEDVLEHVLCFAARASRFIENDIENHGLKNIVIVRAVYSKIREVVDDRISEPQKKYAKVDKEKVSYDIFPPELRGIKIRALRVSVRGS